MGWGGVITFSGMKCEHAVDVTLPVWGGGWGGVGHVSIHVKLNTLWMLR